MAHYLLQLSYTSEAWAALVTNPQDRSKAVESVVHNLGGKMDKFWLSFGEYDLVGLLDMPDAVSAAAFSMAISAGGACRNVKTTPLISAHEGMDAMKKASACGYVPVTRKAVVGAG